MVWRFDGGTGTAGRSSKVSRPTSRPRSARFGAGLPGPGRGGRRPHLLRVCTTAGYPARCCVRGRRARSHPQLRTRSRGIPVLPRDVPDGGLLPSQLLNAYNATPLVEEGDTGKGETVVVFAFDGFQQQDMDLYADSFGLRVSTPEVVGGMPERRGGEANMDLQVIHAIAQDAKLVLVNARDTISDQGDGVFVKLSLASWSRSTGSSRGRSGAFRSGGAATGSSPQRISHRPAMRWPTPWRMGQRRSTPPEISRAWNVSAARTGRRGPHRTMSAWTRWHPSRR